jgi:carbon-monoxide dehydrogenase iron sulfur subunit
MTCPCKGLQEVSRIRFKEDYCVDCRLCEVYCATAHSQSKDVIKAFKDERPGHTRGISVQRRNATSFALNCQHCDEPRCAWACVSGALTKDPETGVVDYNPEKCIGCWTCILACPNGAITRDAEKSQIIKCDLCPDREVPVCVAVCPNRALVL